MPSPILVIVTPSRRTEIAQRTGQREGPGLSFPIKG
jgi:hypothetical protein